MPDWPRVEHYVALAECVAAAARQPRGARSACVCLSCGVRVWEGRPHQLTRLAPTRNTHPPALRACEPARAPTRRAPVARLAARRALSKQETTLRTIRDKALVQVHRLELEELDIKRSFSSVGVALDGDTDEDYDDEDEEPGQQEQPSEQQQPLQEAQEVQETRETREPQVPQEPGK